MTVCGLYFPLPKPVLPIGGIAGGALASVPTPTATDSKGSRNATANRKKPSNSHNSGTTLTDFVTLYPTPKASDWKRQGSPAEYRRNSLDLPAAAGGKLNPQWVEWLMGVPVGWTDCARLEMGKSPHNSFWRGIISGPKPARGESSDE